MKRTHLLWVLAGVTIAVTVTFLGLRDVDDHSHAEQPGRNEIAEPVKVPPQPSSVLTKQPRAPKQPLMGSGEIHGIVYALDGGRTRNAEISVQRIPDFAQVASLDFTPVRVTCDSDGVFTVTKLPDGPYAVSARLGEAYASTRVRLAPQENRVEVKLVLFPGKPIGGHVVNEAGEGIDGARLVPVLHDKAEVERSQSEALAVLSNASGGFSFAGLEPHAWNFYVTADGYAPVLSDELLADTTDNRIVLNPGVKVSGIVIDDVDGAPLGGIWVSGRQKDLNVAPVRAFTNEQGEFEFGLNDGNFIIDVDTSPFILAGGPVQLKIKHGNTPEPLVLRATEGGAIRGRVADGMTGEPIPGAILRARSGNETSRTLSATSDAENGQFEFHGVHEGEYTIAPQFVRGYPRGSHQNKAAQVSVAPGELVEGVEILLFRGICISGTVIDAAGAPVHGAEVRGHAEDWQDQTTSGEDGTFTLAGIPGERDVTVGANTAAMSSKNIEVHVGTEGVSDVTISLDTNRTGSIAGTLVDVYGNPVRGRVSAWSDQPLPNMPGMAETSAEGRFLITGLIAEHYRILAAIGAGGQHNLKEINLGEGQKIVGLQLVLPEEASLSIAGKIVDSDGAPLVASVSCSHIADTGITFYGSTSTLQDGTFKIAGLQAGTYELTPRTNGLEGEPVLVEAGDRDVILTLATPALLYGGVIDAKTQKPIPVFDVAVLDRAGNPNPSDWRRVSNAAGRFEMECDPADFVVFARAKGYQPRRIRGIDANDASDPVIIALEPGDFGLRGIVADSNGKPVPGAAIFPGPLSQYVESQLSNSVAYSDETGSFEITDLSQGELLLSAYHARFGVGSALTQLDERNATALVEIVLTPAGGLEGCVREDAQPLVGVTVVARSASGTVYSARTDSDGCFTLPHVVSGEITLTVQLPGGESRTDVSRTVTVSANSTTTADFDLEAPADSP
ncbi:MAG: carboxypeptidase regulatory-like domain-containing protein [Candidatus Hydrogenedentes bacterium]|nr:carboxypeptidase regulatory-like domain-containing protein [Candidatus Hydrogenedentota bacterium]